MAKPGPEDKFKYEVVLKALRQLEGNHWWNSTPRTRFGVAGAPDIVGVYEGLPVYIEVKRPDGVGSYGVTAIQQYRLEQINKAGGLTAVVKSGKDLQGLIEILGRHRAARDSANAARRPAQKQETNVS